MAHPEVSSHDPVRAAWAAERMVVVPQFLETHGTHAELWRAIHEELPLLEAAATPLSPNPHSKYRHLKPEFLLRTPRRTPFRGSAQWALLELYALPALEDVVKRATGWAAVHRLPLRTDTRFEINGKTNFYDADERTHLGWHLDRVDAYRGQQAVCVLTLVNDWDAHDDPTPTLEYVPHGRLWARDTRRVYLGGNTLTVHDPDAVYHRVLPFERPRDADASSSNTRRFRRVVHVLRFTNDPTPVARPHVYAASLARQAGALAYLQAPAATVLVGVLLLGAVVAAVLKRRRTAAPRGAESRALRRARESLPA